MKTRSVPGVNGSCLCLFTAERLFIKTG